MKRQVLDRSRRSWRGHRRVRRGYQQSICLAVLDRVVEDIGQGLIKDEAINPNDQTVVDVHIDRLAALLRKDSERGRGLPTNPRVPQVRGPVERGEVGDLQKIYVSREEANAASARRGIVVSVRAPQELRCSGSCIVDLADALSCHI